MRDAKEREQEREGLRVWRRDMRKDSSRSVGSLDCSKELQETNIEKELSRGKGEGTGA